MSDRSSDSSRLQGRLYAVVAALLWSSSGYFGKVPALKDFPGSPMALWRAIFASIVLWPLVRRPCWSWKLLPMTLCFSLMNITYLTAFTEGSAANAIWLQNTAPVFVMLVGVWFLGETSEPRDWWLTAFVAAGVGLILFYESQGQKLNTVLLGLASGVCYAGVILSLRSLRELDSAWLVALNHTVAVVVIGIYLLVTSQMLWPRSDQIVWLACLGVLQMGLPYVLFARGLRTLPGHEAAGIGMLEPLLMPVWAYYTIHEMPKWWTMVGALLIFLGLVVKFVARRPR